MPLRTYERKPRELTALGNIPIPGTKAGAIVSIGLVIIAWIALPIARPFILGTGGLGLLFGLALRWKHNR
jgi:hypothetical protein